MLWSGLLVDDVAAGGTGALALEDLDVLELASEDAEGREDGGVVADGLSCGALVLCAGLGVDLGERLAPRGRARCLVEDQLRGPSEVNEEESLDDGPAALTGDGGAVESGVPAEGDADLSIAEVEEAGILQGGRVARGLGRDGVQRRAPAVEERT